VKFPSGVRKKPPPLFLFSLFGRPVFLGPAGAFLPGGQYVSPLSGTKCQPFPIKLDLPAWFCDTVSVGKNPPTRPCFVVVERFFPPVWSVAG